MRRIFAKEEPTRRQPRRRGLGIAPADFFKRREERGEGVWRGGSPLFSRPKFQLGRGGRKGEELPSYPFSNLGWRSFFPKFLTFFEKFPMGHGSITESLWSSHRPHIGHLKIWIGISRSDRTVRRSSKMCRLLLNEAPFPRMVWTSPISRYPPPPHQATSPAIRSLQLSWYKTCPP